MKKEIKLNQGAMSFRIHSFLMALFLMLCLGLTAEAQPEADRLAVFDFRVTSGMTEQVAITLTNQFRSELSKTNQFNMVERSAMNQVMSEQRFGVSDIADRDKAVELGRLLAANKVIVGDIGQVGNTFSVFVRMIDVETSSIELSESFQYRGELDGLLNEFEILARKMAGTYVEKKKRTWWYVAGVAVLGGAAAAWYLTMDVEQTGLPMPPSPPSR